MSNNNGDNNINNEKGPVEGDVKVEKEKSRDYPVACMTCGNRTKLFYDLSASVRDEGEGETLEKNLEGYDIDTDRDPIRCVLCRQFPKFRDNEPIQCEDCLTNATIFWWSGKHKDTILCEQCYKVEKEKSRRKKSKKPKSKKS